MTSALPLTAATYTPATNLAFSNSSDVFIGCLERYGAAHQLMMLAEECSELTQAAMKVYRVQGDPDECESALDHLAEEMADVRIMLEQLTMMFGNDEQVAKWTKYKLDRQRSRLAAH